MPVFCILPDIMLTDQVERELAIVEKTKNERAEHEAALMTKKEEIENQLNSKVWSEERPFESLQFSLVQIQELQVEAERLVQDRAEESHTLRQKLSNEYTVGGGGRVENLIRISRFSAAPLIAHITCNILLLFCGIVTIMIPSYTCHSDQDWPCRRRTTRKSRPSEWPCRSNWTQWKVKSMTSLTPTTVCWLLLFTYIVVLLSEKARIEGEVRSQIAQVRAQSATEVWPFLPNVSLSGRFHLMTLRPQPFEQTTWQTSTIEMTRSASSGRKWWTPTPIAKVGGGRRR